MIEGIPWGDLSGPAILALVAILVITNKLVWHTRLSKVEADWDRRLGKVEKERDKWQAVALQSLGVAERTTSAVEVTAEALSKLPTPSGERR